MNSESDIWYYVILFVRPSVRVLILTLKFIMKCLFQISIVYNKLLLVYVYVCILSTRSIYYIFGINQSSEIVDVCL